MLYNEAIPWSLGDLGECCDNVFILLGIWIGVDMLVNLLNILLPVCRKSRNPFI